VSVFEDDQLMTHRAKWAMRGLLAAVASVALGCLLATHGEAASSSPRVVAIVPSTEGASLMQLDARTLRPVPGGWSRRVEKFVAASSPSGRQVAVAKRDGSIAVLETATGRILERSRDREFPDPDDLYWLHGDHPADTLVAESVDYGSGTELTIYGTGYAVGFSGYVSEVLKDALVVEPEFPPETGVELALFMRSRYDASGSGTSVSLTLPRMSATAPYDVAADALHDRLFVVSSAGLVAQITNASRRPRITYHRVDLNGRPFAASWAGEGKIALSGEDGLGTIDTRTWETRAIAGGVDRSYPTAFGIAAWKDGSTDGLTVYRLDGRRRFRVLVGRRLQSVLAVGGYFYADTVSGARYSVDLRTGRVVRVGVPAAGAMIIAPSFVAIP
jgi:hypothetical protein